MTRSIKSGAKVDPLALEFVVFFVSVFFWFVEETYICLQKILSG